MPSDQWLNLLVQSLRDNGTFHLIALALNYQVHFRKNWDKKKINEKKNPSLCDPMKRYPVEIIFNS